MPFTIKDVEKLAKEARKDVEAKWPNAPNFDEHEYTVGVLVDLVVGLMNRVEALEAKK